MVGKSWVRVTAGVGEVEVVMVPVGEMRMRIRSGDGFGFGLGSGSWVGGLSAVAVVVASWTACVRVWCRLLRPASEERTLQAWGHLKCSAAASRRSRWWESM